MNPTYLSQAGTIINDLTGNIQYRVVNQVGATVEIQVFLNKDKFKQY
jgi:hypothetical protein